MIAMSRVAFVVLIGLGCGAAAPATPLSGTASAAPSLERRLLLISKGDSLLERVLQTHESWVVDRLEPSAYDRIAGDALARYRVAVFDDYTPVTLPPASVSVMYFNPWRSAPRSRSARARPAHAWCPAQHTRSRAGSSSRARRSRTRRSSSSTRREVISRWS
jgi:hypothetical protein